MNANYYYHSGKYVSVTLDVSEHDHWPVRSLKVKGLTANNLFATRPMTDEEIKEVEGAKRYPRYKYYDWQTLINDEQKYNVAPEFIQKLRVYSEKHPLSNQPGLTDDAQEGGFDG